jgi:H+/Na+-translocating ferredoxin:NAD+ oxidoreductase subunit D
VNRATAKWAATSVALVALVPGALIQTLLFGAATLLNVAIAAAAVAVTESSIALMRDARPMRFLRDGGGWITAAVLGLSLPPGAPAGAIVVGTVIGIGIGKHAFGGAGRNPFNPAMVGYAALLLTFPAVFATWPNLDAVDGVTAPTALDAFKHRGGLTVSDVWTHARGFGAFGGANWEWVNLGYLVGGAALVARRLVDWRVPVAVLATIGLLAALCYDGGSSSSLGSPAFHWFSGGTMLAAFFVATDPVTSPTSARGRVCFGILVGAVAFAIRAAPTYPDGFAFAVLIGNAATPLIDRWIGRDARVRA